MDICGVYPTVYSACMNEQIGLDWDAASKAADAGIDRADGNALEEWKSLADDYILRLARRSLELICGAECCSFHFSYRALFPLSSPR